MTLSRQLLLLVVLLVTLFFVGSVSISVYNTRDYLESQLASHAQDAATSLGLSATSHAANGDQAMVTAMVNAMFHRGDYLSIRFEDLDGEAWIERSTEAAPPDVPGWFVSALPLAPPQRDAIMMSGWRQIGRVIVRSHPGLAYQQMWQTTRHTLNLYLLGALGVLLLGLFGLRLLLRPLDDVTAQAAAICNREFPVVRRQPFTYEFRRVVEAMNRLSAQVSAMLGDAERMADGLRSQAYQDPVTGLANRRQFIDVLEHRISDPELFHTGGLLLLQLNAFKAYNQERGYAAGDRLLLEAGRALQEVVGSDERSTLARLSGADFAILVESINRDELKQVATRVVGAVAGLYSSLDLPSGDVGHVGGAAYANQDAKALLAEADQALRQAQSEGPNAAIVHAATDSSVAVRPGRDWRELVESALDEGRFTLLRQPVLGCRDGEVLHDELFLRIADPEQIGSQIPAAEFLPMAERQGLAGKLDRAVLDRVLHQLAEAPVPHRVAVNLATSSLADDGLLDWLEGRLRELPSGTPAPILEWPEYGATAHAERLREWIARLAPIGVEFALDHFGKGFASFAYLRSLKVDYLKVDGSIVHALEEGGDERFLIKTIADIGHGLGMRVVAESVESKAAWQLVCELGLDAGRGFLLAEPV